MYKKNCAERNFLFYCIIFHCSTKQKNMEHEILVNKYSFSFCLFHSGCKLKLFSKILVSNKFQSFSFKKKTFFKSNIISELTKACRLMTRVEPLLVGIKFFEAVNTSEGHFGICDLGLSLKVVESLLDVYYCTG